MSGDRGNGGNRVRLDVILRSREGAMPLDVQLPVSQPSRLGR